MTNDATPAGWYEDPAKVGELRYHDGARWTEHVTIDGAQTTAPFVESAATGDAATFTMSRLAQWRSEVEKPLDVVGRDRVIGQFVTTLDGAPGYRFDDVEGDPIVHVVKPGLKKQVEVRGADGGLIGTITRIGRLRSRYDVLLAGDGRSATVKEAGTDADQWELTVRGGALATITRTVASVADPLNFAAVTYTATMSGPLDDDLERIFLSIPLTIDILDTQAL